jgi:glutamate carboxypeptidase
MGQDWEALGRTLAPRALVEMQQLVDVSTPSGDRPGAERAVALCTEFLPSDAGSERVPCSTESCAPDLLARVQGTGSRRILLLGHLDTVVAHAEHQLVRQAAGRVFGSGTADMKGGVALALAVARQLATDPSAFAELALLLVCDEEWRTAPLAHVARFSGYDACLCFEAGERTAEGEDGVIVRRKGAGTLRVRATGRAAHSGAAPQNGRNALLALAHAAIEVARSADPDGPDQLTVVPTVMRSGEVFNVVPSAGELIFDARSSNTAAFKRVLAAVPEEVGGATLDARFERVWPAMDTRVATAPMLARASELLGREVIGRHRGGASDACYFAAKIPLTIDGLGPRGGGAHTPDEFVLEESFAPRIAVALAIAGAILREPAC